VGIIDDYLSGSSAEDAPTLKSNGSVINQYMSSSEPKKAGEAPTGYNAATGQTSYEKPSEVATGSHTPSLSEVPIKAGKAVGSGLYQAGAEAGQGLREALSGKPASGIGKIGMAPFTAIGALTSDPVSSVVGDITGNQDIANRAGALVGLLPVAPSTRAVKNLPIVTNKKAFNNLVEMIEPQNAGDVARAMRADPRLTPADLSPAVQSATQKLFTVEGDKPKNYINSIVNQRASGANSAVNAAMDASLGSRVDPVAKLNELKTNIVNAGKQAIEPALAKTKPVDITPVVKHIDNVLKPGVNEIISNPENMLPYTRVQQTLSKWRDFITNDSVNLTNPNALHKLQSGIRRQAEGLLKSSDPEARATGYALYGLRNEFINAIGKAGPQTVDKAGNAVSEYRAGLSKYRDENDVADAFRHGHDAIIKNGRALEDNPEFFKQWVKEATPEEIEAAKQGANIAIRTAMNAYRAPVTNTTSKAQQMAQVDFNRQRIESLFGKEQADKIFTRLENERKIAETNNNLIHGSQTAMRMQADSRVALPTKKDLASTFIPPALLETASAFTTGVPGLAASSYIGAKLVGAGLGKVATALAKEKNAQLAKLALPTEGPSREALIQQLEAVAAEHARPRLSVMNKGRLAARSVGLPVSP
jgi:hypothetical protein